MNIHIVYCHPSEESFTTEVRDVFIQSLVNARHCYTISDLYQKQFRTDMDESEYRREAFYDNSAPVPSDVLEEQQLIQNSDVLVFIFPIFWNDAPAKLKGWFDRVWTYRFAYGFDLQEQCEMHQLQKVIFLCICGNTIKTLGKSRRNALKATFIRDRIFNRAKKTSLILLDGMSRGMKERVQKHDRHLKTVQRLAQSL